MFLQKGSVFTLVRQVRTKVEIFFLRKNEMTIMMQNENTEILVRDEGVSVLSTEMSLAGKWNT